MADQLFEDGKVVTVDGQELECTAVSHQELEPGVRSNFAYTFRLKSEVDAEREAEAKHQEELKAAEAQAEPQTEAQPETATEPVNKPEEETQYVK